MSKASDPNDSKGRPKVQCKICKKWFHRVDVHLDDTHSMTTEEYQTRYPRAELMSDFAKARAKEAEKPGRKDILIIDDPTEEAKVTTKTVAEFFKGETDKAKAKKETAVALGKGKKAPKGAAPANPPAASSSPVVSTEEAGVFRLGTARIKMREDLTEEDKQFVPAHDDGFEIDESVLERWELIVTGIQSRTPVMIYGPTGCGKSEGVLQLAAAVNQPIVQLNLDSEIRRADFVGDKNVEVDEATKQAITRWIDGTLPMCIRRGYWLLLDEIDAMQAHIAFVLQNVLAKHALYLPATRENVSDARDYFRIITTANTVGRGDESGLYVGTNALNEAFLDRFGVVIKADYPPEEKEVDILVGRTKLNREDAQKMVRVARDVRKALATESCFCTFGTRRLIHWADKSVRLGSITRGASVAVLNRLSRDDSTFVAGIIQRVWGSVP